MFWLFDSSFLPMTQPLLTNTGILLFSFAVLIQVITLPVEYNASARAIAQLRENLLQSHEEPGVRSVLNAAALTYVAATAVALSQLFKMLVLRGRRR